MNEQTPELIIPVIAEELKIDATLVKTGGVRVSKRLVTEKHQIQQELLSTSAEVERVTVDRIVDGPQEPYQDGSTLVIPIVEEVVTIERKWVVREEVRIHKRVETKLVETEVSVDHEEVVVERFDANRKTVELE